MSAKPARKKYGAEPKRATKTPVPGWIWLVTGCLLGAFAMFLLHISKIPPGQPNPTSPEDATRKAAKTHTPNAEEDAVKPRYDFYRLLKENQPPHSPRTESPPTPPAVTNDANANFVLQVASYKTSEDAEATRAKLLLLGLTARIEKVTLRNTETWHRVLIGPVKSVIEADKVRAQLTENKYDALVLKIASEPAAKP